MSSAAVEISLAPKIAEVASIATIWQKRGHEIRVAVKETEHGAAVDVREYLTEEKYPTVDGTSQKAAVRRKVAGKGERVTKANGYVGPTKKGLWLSPTQAVELAQAIFAAAEAAERL